MPKVKVGFYELDCTLLVWISPITLADLSKA
jgi:hypothetical protein